MCSSSQGSHISSQYSGHFPSLPCLRSREKVLEGTRGRSDAGTRQRWHRQHHQCVRRLPAPAVIRNTFLSVEARPFQPVLENTSSRPGTHRGAAPPERAEPVSQPSEIGCEEEREEEEGECSRNPPPPGRCSASLEREESGEDFPPCFVGSGHTRKAAQEGVLFHFPHIQAESDDGKERKNGWQEAVEKQTKGSARAGSAQAGTSKAWPHPWGLCGRQRQPRLCGMRAGLQSCRRASAGRAGAFAEHSASSSPLHPGRTSLLLLTEEDQAPRAWAGSTQELAPLVSSVKPGTTVCSCFFPCLSAQVHPQFADSRVAPSPAPLIGLSVRPSQAKLSLLP